MGNESTSSRTLSSDSTTLRSMSHYDQMDPEIRAQIQSNIHVLYDPSTAPRMHIATCRRSDGVYLALLVRQDELAKALSNPNSLASEPRTTRGAALVSLLEATEQQIGKILINTNVTNNNRASTSSQSHSHGRKTTSSRSPSMSPSPTFNSVPFATTSLILPPEPKGIHMLPNTTDKFSVLDYSEKPKEKTVMPWKKHLRFETAFSRTLSN